MEQNDSASCEKAEENMAVEVTEEHKPSCDGCSHYVRRCALVCPTCSEVFICRVCHDAEKDDDHTIDRFRVTTLKCLKCDHLQKKSGTCEKCEVQFGRYVCLHCCMFDDVEKEQFHCEKCGLCRVGGRENFVHCDKCELCLPKDIVHTCLEGVAKDNCPVCFLDLHTSRESCIPLSNCAHLLHSKCYANMLKHGNYSCPKCGKTMVEMSDVWSEIDRMVEEEVLPEDNRDSKIGIWCKDCNRGSEIKLSFVGWKCGECGSYNTARGNDPEGVEVQQEPPQEHQEFQGPEPGEFD